MATHRIFLLTLLALACLLTCNKGFELNRQSFPPKFIFGTSSSAYQYEGATAQEYGRGPSIWDTFTKDHSEKIQGNSSGQEAVDFYNRYEEDISLMEDIGFDSFRFSISWSRILPKGRKSQGVNPKGVEFYNKLLNALEAKKIKPLVTLFHWDLPQALEDEYGGFLSSNIVKDFHDYANLCFTLFGDRVKDWTTFNEPYIFITGGYETGIMAPGRCSNYAGKCPDGHSGIDPYVAVHNLLLAHADVVNLYRTEFKDQGGVIGIVEICHWMEPKFRSLDSRMASYRAMDFMIGRVLHPIVFGDYPKTMRSLVGCRLPEFTEAQSKLLKGSFDYLGINYYTARYADHPSETCNIYQSPTNDTHADVTYEGQDGQHIGTPTSASWLKVYPQGIEELLLYIKDNYNNPPITITENGVVDPEDPDEKDEHRIKYHQDHLVHLHNAIRAGANVGGYYVWSFLDCFEWFSGYTSKFGLIRVDRERNFARSKKGAADWFKTFLQKSGTVEKQPEAADNKQLRGDKQPGGADNKKTEAADKQAKEGE